MLAFRVEIPIPNIKSKKGPAKQPVKAISPKPFWEMDTLAIRSPVEFPQASMVTPSKVDGSPVSIPKISIKSTRILQAVQIHSTLMINAKTRNILK
jgi:hypothetical protein